MTEGFRTGTVAIVGRPNVGKSTLLNRLIGQKLSITADKPQTTRSRITGIQTTDDAQYIFVDTPGFQTRYGGTLNRSMNRAVEEALSEVDVVLFVVEAGRWVREDEKLLRLLPQDKPVILVINKVDRLEDKRNLLPFIDERRRDAGYAEIVPVSATAGTQIDALLAAIRARLPEAPAFHAPDEMTDRPGRFLAAELIREKVFRLTGEEVPYAVGVAIDQFEEEGRLTRIHATIYVDKPGHKAILIGKGGEKLKRIGTEARQDMERLFGGKVFLQCWVKVKPGWADNAQFLRALGYE
jgi:GTPase